MRPELSKELTGQEFKKWYYLKEELVSFCKENGIPASGSKGELTERISEYLDTGTYSKPVNKNVRKADIPEKITPDSKIEENFVCSEKHRAFFREHIGKSFSFNVAFQKWLKSNSGKTYREAIDAFHDIKTASYSGKTKIDRQFEYNTYIRDFFENNTGRSLDDAIRCWKHKKSLPGHNRYEDSDLSALEG